MVPRGLEPRTLRLLAVRSNQLSYETAGEEQRQRVCALSPCVIVRVSRRSHGSSTHVWYVVHLLLIPHLAVAGEPIVLKACLHTE